jgi:CheY-like chemotaxis protein
MNKWTGPSRGPALLVDDQPDILATTAAFLIAAGFDITRARSGEAGLACLATGQRFVLLVTDYAMPGINGVDLTKQALERLPDLKVLIMTGFPDDAQLFGRPPGVAVLAKPFRRAHRFRS